MIDYPAARAVALIVRTGSFEAAARALNLSPSAVSQRVRGLEERLGTVLIRRGPPATATEAGARLCRHMEQVGLLESALRADLPGLPLLQDGPVTLEIAVNADSLGTWFLPAMARFTEATGHLLSITADDEEHTAERLRRGEVIGAVTVLERPVQGCTALPLGALRYHATASPAFMARHFPNGVSAEALARAPALSFGRKDGLQRDWTASTFGEEIALPCHHLPTTEGFVAASLAGIGWGLNPAPLVAEHLAAGRLVELRPGATLDRPLVWQLSLLARDSLAPLSRAIREAARPVLI